jgi:hypothetical protein
VFLWDIAGKCDRARQGTNENMVHVNCMLNTYGYKHTLRICNTYCFSTATMVAWMRLNVMLYVHCLSFNRIYIQDDWKRWTQFRTSVFPELYSQLTLLHGCALGERSSCGIWKFRTSSFKCYVDHSHTMYSSGNIDVRNWVHLFESPCVCVYIYIYIYIYIRTAYTEDKPRQHNTKASAVILWPLKIDTCISDINKVHS